MTALSAYRRIGPSAGRLGAFVQQVFRPHIYVTYGILWSLALEGSAVVLSGTAAWTPGWGTVVRCVTVVLILLFLRVVDEQKDLEYDRVHNPRRPLVTGAISVTELRAAMLIILAVVIGLNLAVTPAATVVAVAALGYALMLMALERGSATIRDAQLLNLAVTYPVQLIIGAYVYLSAADEDLIEPDWRAVPLMLVFAGFFLHFEFARKTAWQGTPAERTYSQTRLGPVGSAVVALVFVGGGALIALLLFKPWHSSGVETIFTWLPYAPLILPAVAAWHFLARRRPVWPALYAMATIVLSYLALVVQAAVIGRITP
jgi:4-hydroxybenzoate polyprenyltransferase